MWIVRFLPVFAEASVAHDLAGSPSDLLAVMVSRSADISGVSTLIRSIGEGAAASAPAVPEKVGLAAGAALVLSTSSLERGCGSLACWLARYTGHGRDVPWVGSRLIPGAPPGEPLLRAPSSRRKQAQIVRPETFPADYLHLMQLQRVCVLQVDLRHFGQQMDRGQKRGTLGGRRFGMHCYFCLCRDKSADVIIVRIVVRLGLFGMEGGLDFNSRRDKRLGDMIVDSCYPGHAEIDRIEMELE